MPTGVKKNPPSKKAKSKVAKSASKAAKVNTDIKQPTVKLTLIGSFSLAKQTFETIANFWRPLGGILLVYLGLNLLFASGLSAISSTSSNLHSSLSTSSTYKINDALRGFGAVVGGTATSNPQANSLMQSILIVIGSLAIIWTLRHLLAGQTVGVKQAYYHSTTPFIPFVLVIFVIILQLLPLMIGASAVGILLTSAFGSSVASFFFLLLFLVLAAWSLYMLTASAIALYIVTLPDMQPLQALRSAKKLVSSRRFAVTRRLLFLPLIIFMVMGVLLLPLILFIPVLVAPVFYLLGIASILFVHTYLYSLYRNLLG